MTKYLSYIYTVKKYTSYNLHVRFISCIFTYFILSNRFEHLIRSTRALMHPAKIHYLDDIQFSWTLAMYDNKSKHFWGCIISFFNFVLLQFYLKVNKGEIYFIFLKLEILNALRISLLSAYFRAKLVYHSAFDLLSNLVITFKIKTFQLFFFQGQNNAFVVLCFL